MLFIGLKKRTIKVIGSPKALSYMQQPVTAFSAFQQTFS